MARRRVRENWLWIGPLIVLAVVFPPEAEVFGSRMLDRVADVVGLLLILLGALVRTVARSFKHEHGTSSLVVGGPYAHVRHPLYFGTLLCGLGLSVIHGSPWVIGGILLSYVAWYAFVIRREERKLAARWPEAHAAYRERVAALFPGPKRVAALLAEWPTDVRRAVIREADALFFWPMAGLAVRVWSLSGSRERFAANQNEALVLGGLAVLVGVAWLVVKHGLRKVVTPPRTE